jgi:hypothetical protein
VDENILSSVPFSRQSVEDEAKRYGGEGYSLIDERGKYWLWDDCYNTLLEIESQTLIVVSPPEPSKRRGVDFTGVGDQQYLLHKTKNKNL